MTKQPWATTVVAIAALAATVALAAWGSNRGSNTPAGAQTLGTSTPGPPPVRRAAFDPQHAIEDVAFWRGRVRQDPEGALGLGNLAAAYMALGRQSGDVSLAAKAEQAARRALKLAPTHRATRLRLSRALLTQHRFGEALAVLKNSGAQDADAQRLKADLFIETGDYPAAQRALGLSPPGREDPNFYSLRGRLLEIQGQPQAALADARTATVQAEANIDASPESIAWYYWRQARVLSSTGRHEEAERQLKQALVLFPRDYRAMNALAHIKANQGDWKEAALWARQAAQVVPEPDTLALLGDAYAALGRPKEAAQQFAIVEAISRLARSRGVIHDRQRALFYADHSQSNPQRLDEAVALARGELKLRRDIYSHDALAWACYKKGLLAEARQASSRALAFNTQDAMLWFHAGMIARASGQKAQARRYLEKALAINPRFHPSAPAVARATLSKLAG